MAAGYVLMASAWILIVRLIPGTPAALLAPPLFVSGLEWAASPPGVPAVRNAGKTAGPRRWLLLTLAAAAGSMAALLHPALPSAVAAAIGVTVVAALAQVLGDRHPSALAISLIPFVLGRPGPLEFTGAVAVTAAVLLLAGTRLRWRAMSPARTRTETAGAGQSP